MATGLLRSVHDRIGSGGIAIFLIIAAALVFILANVIGDRAMERFDTSAGQQFPCTVLSVYDGDGPINCAERNLEGKQVMVRLRGIEAREMDNSCQAEVCPEVSGAEAKAQLTRLAFGRLQCESFGPSYDRVDASCRNPLDQDLSCELVRSGAAVRWPEYDPEGRMLPCIPGQP